MAKMRATILSKTYEGDSQKNIVDQCLAANGWHGFDPAKVGIDVNAITFEVEKDSKPAVKDK